MAAIVREYEEREFLYRQYCVAMRQLLTNLLDDHGFKYQVSHRVKSLESIKEKVRRNARSGRTYRRLGDIEDVAGVRVVFYLESDKDRFVRLLYRELTPRKLRMEVHHRYGGYRSLHVTARLGPKRLALSEYRRFAGLACEIQLTSALFHAWAEIEHDIFYKQGRLARAVERKALRALRADLEQTMLHHLESASNVFESVAARVRRVRRT